MSPMGEPFTSQSRPVEKLNLRTVPFADQERRVIRAKAEQEAREAAEKKRAEFEMKVAVTDHLTARLPREGMAPVFFAAARRIAMELLLGNIPIRTGAEAGQAINALMAAGRMEAGGVVDDDITRPPQDRAEAERRLAKIHDEVAKRRAEVAGQASGE